MISRRPQDWVVPGVLGVLLLGYAVVPLDPVPRHLLYDVTAVLAMLVGFRGVYVHRPTHSRGWVLTLCGFGGWVVGDLMWFYEEFWLGDSSFPGPSDPVYLLSYLVLGAGVLTMVRTRRRKRPGGVPRHEHPDHRCDRGRGGLRDRSPGDRRDAQRLGFKAFNDTHGHQAGDGLLRQAATAWRADLPADTALARYGGEEFAVLLPGYRLEQAEGVIARLRDRTPGGQTFSAGICEWRAAGRPENPALLVATADQALYRAKKDGRDRIVLAHPATPAEAPATASGGDVGHARP